MTQKIDKKIIEMVAKEMKNAIEYYMRQAILDTPRKQKLRKLLGIKQKTYLESLEENDLNGI